MHYVCMGKMFVRCQILPLRAVRNRAAGRAISSFVKFASLFMSHGYNSLKSVSAYIVT